MEPPPQYSVARQIIQLYNMKHDEYTKAQAEKSKEMLSLNKVFHIQGHGCILEDSILEYNLAGTVAGNCKCFRFLNAYFKGGWCTCPKYGHAGSK